MTNMSKIYTMAREVPKSAREYLTPGKPYLAEDYPADNSFCYRDDNDRTRWSLWHNSGHLNGADWTRLTEAEAQAIMGERQWITDTAAREGDAEIGAELLAAETPAVAVPTDLWGDIVLRLQIIRSLSLYGRESAVKASINGLLTRIKEAGLS